jgi:hypothetical protein
MWARLVGLGGFAVVPDVLANIRLFGTRWQSASDAERFARWVGVLDRWSDDDVFMRMAEREVRGINARHQVAMLLDPLRMLRDHPRQLRSFGGTLGARLYGSPHAYAWSIATLPYYLAVRGASKVARHVWHRHAGRLSQGAKTKD